MKPTLNIFLWGIAFLLLTGSVFYFFSTLKSIETVVPTSKISLGQPSGVVSSIITYSGTVLKNNVLAVTYGTHQLVDNEGKIKAYLESQKIDMRILEGTKVTLEGKRERMVEAGIPLLAVEKVNYK